MKRAVLLHGTDGSPEGCWFPWLKAKLEAAGYEVWAPLLPANHTPNQQVYNDFLLGSGWDFSNNIVVGHSAGAVSVLNLLMDTRCPHIKLGVMVGAWAHRSPHGNWEPQQFAGMFPPEGFDFKTIKAKASALAFLHGADDPYCPLEQAQYLAAQLSAPITAIPNGQHLGSRFTELPELLSIIEPKL